jgi:hypothetical protein
MLKCFSFFKKLQEYYYFRNFNQNPEANNEGSSFCTRELAKVERL